MQEEGKKVTLRVQEGGIYLDKQPDSDLTKEGEAFGTELGIEEKKEVKLPCR